MLISPDAPAFLAIEEHVSYGLSPDIPKGSSNQVLHLVELWKEDQDGDHDGNNPINIYAAANLGKCPHYSLSKKQLINKQKNLSPDVLVKFYKVYESDWDPASYLLGGRSLNVINSGTPEYGRQGVGEIVDTLDLDAFARKAFRFAKADPGRKTFQCSLGITCGMSLRAPEGIEETVATNGSTLPNFRVEGFTVAELRQYLVALTELGKMAGVPCCQDGYGGDREADPQAFYYVYFCERYFGPGVRFPGLTMVFYPLTSPATLYELGRHTDDHNSLLNPDTMRLGSVCELDDGLGCGRSLWGYSSVAYGRKALDDLIYRVRAGEYYKEAFLRWRVTCEPYQLPGVSPAAYWRDGMGSHGFYVTVHAESNEIKCVAGISREVFSKLSLFLSAPIQAIYDILQNCTIPNREEFFFELVATLGWIRSGYTTVASLIQLQRIISTGGAELGALLPGGFGELFVRVVRSAFGGVGSGPAARYSPTIARDVAMREFVGNATSARRIALASRKRTMMGGGGSGSKTAERSEAIRLLRSARQGMFGIGNLTSVNVVAPMALAGYLPHETLKYNLPNVSKKVKGKDPRVKAYVDRRVAPGSESEVSDRELESKFLTLNQANSRLYPALCNQTGPATEGQGENGACLTTRAKEREETYFPSMAFAVQTATDDTVTFVRPTLAKPYSDLKRDGKLEQAGITFAEEAVPNLGGVAATPRPVQPPETVDPEYLALVQRSVMEGSASLGMKERASMILKAYGLEEDTDSRSDALTGNKVWGESDATGDLITVGASSTKQKGCMYITVRISREEMESKPGLMDRIPAMCAADPGGSDLLDVMSRFNNDTQFRELVLDKIGRTTVVKARHGTPPAGTIDRPCASRSAVPAVVTPERKRKSRSENSPIPRKTKGRRLDAGLHYPATAASQLYNQVIVPTTTGAEHLLLRCYATMEQRKQAILERFGVVTKKATKLLQNKQLLQKGPADFVQLHDRSPTGLLACAVNADLPKEARIPTMFQDSTRDRVGPWFVQMVETSQKKVKLFRCSVPRLSQETEFGKSEVCAVVDCIGRALQGVQVADAAGGSQWWFFPSKLQARHHMTLCLLCLMVGKRGLTGLGKQVVTRTLEQRRSCKTLPELLVGCFTFAMKANKLGRSPSRKPVLFYLLVRTRKGPAGLNDDVADLCFAIPDRRYDIACIKRGEDGADVNQAPTLCLVKPPYLATQE